jgi:hypothetical protein
MVETAIGVIGLLSLFGTVVDCFEYVRIAKTFERDFATAQIKLDCAGWRFSRWGEAVGICDASTDSDSVLAERYERVEKILKHLELLWIQARQKSEIFRRPGIETYALEDMEPVQAIVHKGVGDKLWKRMGRHGKGPAESESERASRLEKGKWAVYKKEELNELVRDITELVGQLEIVLPPGGGMVLVPEIEVEEVSEAARQALQDIAEKEVTEFQGAMQKEVVQSEQQHSTITPLQVVETLREGARGQDPYVEEAANKIIEKLRPETPTAGKTYNVHSVMHKVENNSGIVSAFFQGTQNQYNYRGGERDP